MITFKQFCEGVSKSESDAHRWLTQHLKDKPGYYVRDRNGQNMHDEPHSSFEKALKWHKEQPGHKFGNDFANGERIHKVK
jgi:hypothetical protein